MKYLGIDYGTKRIGIAVSDDGGEFAFPKAILSTKKDSVDTIAALAAEEGIEAIIIGESLAQNEAPNEVFSAAAAFKAKLATRIALPVFFEREGFSSVEAYRYQEKKGPADDSAAAIILQRFLDKMSERK
jgi:putative holliday junction resolvase